MEGHYPEPHRLRQRRHCAATKHLAAAAGQPDASRWQQDRGRCDFHALSTMKAKIADSPGPPRQRTHELVATSAKFSMNDNKKTPEPASSAEEKRDVNPTSALGPLLTCMRQGNQAICRTR